MSDPLWNKYIGQDAIERIILRRLHEDRIAGFTLEMAHEIARAAIEAMRKPSKEMEKAGRDDLRAWGFDEADENDAACCFTSMIDSALSQDTHSLPSTANPGGSEPADRVLAGLGGQPAGDTPSAPAGTNSDEAQP